jgi:phosphoglucosamine mutase
MFGTSGIRGIFGEYITPELAFQVAAIFTRGEDRLVLGRDIRDSGPALLQGACFGANSSGADVIDLGIVPTPTVALASKKHSSRAIMLTASHNPPEYNGLKLIQDGKEIDKGMEKEIEKAYKTGNQSAWTGRSGNRYHDKGIIDEHKAMVMGMVDRGLIARKKPRVLVDCNGAASVITPHLLTDLGCSVVSVNASPACFNRPSEPNAANLAYLSSLVREGEFDFAIAHDGDGDRCMIIDESGAALPMDAQLAMMIEHEMAESVGKKRIISTVEASLAIRDVVQDAGGEIDITPVGSTFIGDLMERNSALFGGEPCGEYIFQKGVHVPDAILAAAKFVEIFCQKGRFSKLKAAYRQNPMARERFPAHDKQKAIGRIKEKVRKLGIEGNIRDDDGIRVDEKDGWFLIRASGTEPIIRLTMEYRSENKLQERKIALAKLIKDETG